MLRSFKTEIDPSPEQRRKINRTIGVCRFVYNMYLAHNRDLYNRDGSFMSAREFSVWLNNVYLKDNQDHMWIKDVSSKAVKKSIEDGYSAFCRFFKHASGYPRFKKKNGSNVKMYFVKNNKTDCLCERHRISIPTLGWIKIKEKGYIPTTNDGYVIKSGTISVRAGRYYISATVELPDKAIDHSCRNDGIGIDLGVKDFAVLSDGRRFENINRSSKIIKLEKQLRRNQRSLSRMIYNSKKGKSTQNSNIQKQLTKIEKLCQRISNIRTDYINKSIVEIVKTKPSYITIEDLNVSGMVKNRHLSKSIASQRFFEFKEKLATKCDEQGIELRIVDRWFPSSKTCNCCGNINRNLGLGDRVYKCGCGYVEDRDLNAAFNLRDAIMYNIA